MVYHWVASIFAEIMKLYKLSKLSKPLVQFVDDILYFYPLLGPENNERIRPSSQEDSAMCDVDS